MSKKFYVLNSFALHPFGGNPAAVFLDAHQIPEEQLLPIAKQLNLIETVYVYSEHVNDVVSYRLRFFTPERELPLAGHPTIAAWSALVRYGGVQIDQDTAFIQRTGAGLQEIRLSYREEEVFVLMKQPQPTFTAIINDLTAVSEAVGVDPVNFCPNLPIQGVDVGLGHLVVPVRTLDAVKSARMNIEKLKTLCERVGMHEAQLFCFETHSHENDLFTRNFSPREGLEDPACGNGNGAIGAYLAWNKFSEQENFDLRAEQGHTLGMPSLIQISKKQTHVESVQIWIGGSASPMIEGQMLI